MSLVRLVYYSAIGGGWAGFIGWLVAELILLQGNGNRGLATTVLVGMCVGAAIGAGLNIVAGMANAQFKNLVMRAPVGLIGGGIGGALGILAGSFIFWLAQVLGIELMRPDVAASAWLFMKTCGLRAVGFMLLGLGVGVVEGIYERSPNKIRNGVIGGLVGGFIGGLLFDPISAGLASSSGIASRAASFVILGLCIGAMIGIVQVILKEASLRVLDGYGVGREVVLGDAVTVIGRGDHLRLPFLGRSNADLDVEHFRIVRQGNSNFVIEDNHSKLGVSVRSEGANSYDSVQQPRELRDGDVIRFGVNLVRFSQRKKKGPAAGAAVGSTATLLPSTPAGPPPPPPRKAKPVAAAAPTATASRPASPSAAATAAPVPTVSSPVAAPKPLTSVPPPPPPPPRKKKV